MDSLESKFEAELTATEKLAQFEKEKLSRRQALARIGFQAGAAAIAALTADELLRKVGKEMQRRASDNKVAQQVAKELEQSGVASAQFFDPCMFEYPCVQGLPCMQCADSYCGPGHTCEDACQYAMCGCKQLLINDYPECFDSNGVPLGICPQIGAALLACQSVLDACVLNC